MNGEGNLNLHVRRGVVLTAVQQRGISSSTLLLFAAIVFMVRAVMLMLGPLLVALANDFGTSIAVSGQLAAATFVAWGITAPLVGPISDTYGRSPFLLILIGFSSRVDLAFHARFPCYVFLVEYSPQRIGQHWVNEIGQLGFQRTSIL